MSSATKRAIEKAFALSNSAKQKLQVSTTEKSEPGIVVFTEKDGYERKIANIGSAASVCVEACFGNGPRSRDMHIGGSENIIEKVPRINEHRSGPLFVFTCSITGRFCITGKDETIRRACERV